jgi:fluoroquinolone transport system ATP-binding protein
VGFLAHGRILVTGAPAELKRRFGRPLVEVTTSTPGGAAIRSFPIEGIGHNAEFLDLLRTGEVARLHTLEASLDDIFIAATASGTQ